MKTSISCCCPLLACYCSPPTIHMLASLMHAMTYDSFLYRLMWSWEFPICQVYVVHIVTIVLYH